MVEKEIRYEIHDMSNKIKELQDIQNTLTNGQRYAAINEIEKSIQPLRNDLYHLEHELYSQETDDKILQKQIDNILDQISKLEDIKSDLTARIHTETEHTRQELNNKIIKIIVDELRPIKEDINDNKKEIALLKDDISNLKNDIITNQAEQQIKDAKRFDRLQLILAGVVAVVTGSSFLIAFFETPIRTLINVFF